MKKFFVLMIEWYQRHVSPGLPRACRYTPTCSQYAKEAIQRFGALKGTYLALRRVLRCNPFGSFGYDPVPEGFSLRLKTKLPRRIG